MSSPDDRGGGGDRAGRPLGSALAAVVVAAVVVMVSVVVMAQSLRGAAPATPWVQSSSAGGAARPSAPSRAAVPSRSTTPSRIPAPPAGSTGELVRLGAVAGSHPYAADVAELLDRHFTAINTGDYSSWASTVDPVRAADQPADAWRRAYRSTRDESVEVDSITDDGAGGVLVALSFVSHQSVVDAPPDLPVARICWRSTWPIAGLGSGGRITRPDRGATSARAC